MSTDTSAVETPEALAKKAVTYVLTRIRENEDLRWHMGEGTEAFARLVKAQAAIEGKPENAIKTLILVRKPTRKSDSEILRDVREIVDSTDWQYSEKEAIKKLETVLGR